MASFAVVVHVSELLTGGQADDVRQALERTEAADGVGPLSEEARLRLAAEQPGATHLVVSDDQRVCAYAQLDVVASLDDPSSAEATGELFVVPEFRGRGIGSELLSTARAIAPHLSVWAHGDLPAARHLAERAGLIRVRDLWQLRRSLGAPIPEPAVPTGVTVRTFRPGEDEAAWLHLNASAFAHHPEQGGWTEHDLRLREQEPWFDPDGFFLAEREGRLVAFHWTKVHSDSHSDTNVDPALGEVYVLGVDPAESGHGLGSLLTAVGLRYLQGRGLDTVLLYVEATNAAALTVYERQGFERYAVDASYRTRDGS